MVRPHLEYANSVWCPYKKGDIAGIEKVQKRATKLVISLKHLSYIERLRRLKLPTLKNRRLRGDIIGPCLKHAGTPGRRQDSITGRDAGRDAGTVATIVQ